MKSSPIQSRVVRLSPRSLSQSVAGFLRQFAGKTLSVQVLRALPEGRVLLSAGPQRFEAVLRGASLRAGESIEVEVRLLSDGTIELGVLKEGALSMLDLQSALSQFPQTLSQMLLAFLFAKGKGTKGKGTSKGAPEQAAWHKGEAGLADSLEEEFSWIRSVLEKSRFPEDSGLALLLRRLFREKNAEATQKLAPQASFQESWFVEYPGREGQEAHREEWNFEAVSRHEEAPAYFFFQLRAESLGGLSGAFLSAKNADFSKLHVFVRSERKDLADYLQRQAKVYKEEMQKSGIEILEFSVFSEPEPPSLDLQA